KPRKRSSYAMRWFLAQAVLRLARARPGFKETVEILECLAPEGLRRFRCWPAMRSRLGQRQNRTATRPIPVFQQSLRAIQFYYECILELFRHVTRFGRRTEGFNVCSNFAA